MRHRLIFGMVILVYFLITNISAQALQGYPVTISALQVSPDGTQIAVATVSGSLKLYDAITPTIVIHTLQASGDRITDIGWSPDGTRIAAITSTGRISLWTSSGSSLYSIASPSPNSIGTAVSLSWSPDGAQLAISDQGQGTIILTASTGSQLLSLPTGDTYDNTWSPSTNLAATSIAGVFVRENSIMVNKLPALTYTGVPGVIPARLATNPNGILLAIQVITYETEGVSNLVVGSMLEIRAFPSLTPIGSVDIPYNGRIPGKIEWSNDGNYVALSSFDDPVRIFEAPTLEVPTLRLVDEINIGNAAMAFDWMNNSQLIYASNDGTLNVVGFTTDLTTTLTLPQRPTAPHASVTPASVTPVTLR